jgi:chaperonin cofactor prefoldin
LTPSEASRLIIELSDAIEKLQKQVDGLAISFERLQSKVEDLDGRLAPSQSAGA